MHATNRWTQRMTLAVRCVAHAAPALAVLFVARTTHADVIVDQSSGATGQYIQSQDITNLPQYSAEAFDDFTITVPYRITTLQALGREYYGNPSNNLNVVGGIYADPDMRLAPIIGVSGVQVGNDLFFDFGGAVLPAGHYWVGAFIVRPNTFGGWYWILRLPVSGSQAVWHNPGGGHGYGTEPVPMGNVLVQADLMYILNGDRFVPPTPPATPSATASTTNTPASTSTPTPTGTPTTAVSPPAAATPSRTASRTPTRTPTRTRTPTPAGGSNQQGGSGGQGNN